MFCLESNGNGNEKSSQDICFEAFLYSGLREKLAEMIEEVMKDWKGKEPFSNFVLEDLKKDAANKLSLSKVFCLGLSVTFMPLPLQASPLCDDFVDEVVDLAKESETRMVESVTQQEVNPALVSVPINVQSPILVAQSPLPAEGSIPSTRQNSQENPSVQVPIVATTPTLPIPSANSPVTPNGNALQKSPPVQSSKTPTTQQSEIPIPIPIPIHIPAAPISNAQPNQTNFQQTSAVDRRHYIAHSTPTALQSAPLPVTSRDPRLQQGKTPARLQPEAQPATETAKIGSKRKEPPSRANEAQPKRLAGEIDGHFERSDTTMEKPIRRGSREPELSSLPALQPSHPDRLHSHERRNATSPVENSSDDIDLHYIEGAGTLLRIKTSAPPNHGAGGMHITTKALDARHRSNISSNVGSPMSPKHGSSSHTHDAADDLAMFLADPDTEKAKFLRFCYNEFRKKQ
ncbi:hypothetical protein HDU97_003541 [Phlyctochytrium planicorne]|nr:hypothetical protein HDU97_003541 [Phlyctochytrium planicorne]